MSSFVTVAVVWAAFICVFVAIFDRVVSRPAPKPGERRRTR